MSGQLQVRDGGCVSLVSSGESQEESVFMDASESGDDVFFVTGQPLVDRDYDHALDVYDARVCSAQAPCASEPVAPPPCDSGDSCKAAPSPQPEIFGAPASATFNGQGNVVTIGATSTKKVTPKQKLESALKVCERKHRHNRHKRQLCQRRIRGAQTRLGARGATVRHRNVKARREGKRTMRGARLKWSMLIAAMGVALMLFGAASATAVEPWWQLSSTSAPSILPPGGTGTLRVVATNLGDGSVPAESNPVTITRQASARP